jgi:hypothetical protein
MPSKLSAKRLSKPLVSSILAKAIVTALLAVAGAWIKTSGWLSRSSTLNASLAGLAAACWDSARALQGDARQLGG